MMSHMGVRRWWTDEVVPRGVDVALSGAQARRWRDRVCGDPAVHGVVLEIGFASGANLGHYRPTVSRVLAVEPAEVAWLKGQSKIRAAPCSVERVGTDAARLALPTAVVDAAVSTWTLCTVPDLTSALREIARTLAPGAALHFAEHTVSASPRVAAIGRAVQPWWGAWSGGCHLDRDLVAELEAASYDVTVRHQEGWFIEGVARPRH